MHRWLWSLVVLALVVPATAVDLSRSTIADITSAFADGTLTSEGLTDYYLARIAAYDKQGPQINAVITLNPKAIELARIRDAQRKAGTILGPLHGIPVVLKDNYNTADMPTTGGSQLLMGSIPPEDAFVVKKLRTAGAIILAKVNMSEFAFGGGAPNGFSSMGGQTRNPHDPNRGPAGSSGGPGAAVAAAFAQFALGSDSGGSIRAPCAANGIAGLKPTYGLISRNGIIPLALSLDTSGPMARSVHDIAVALGVMAGPDPTDPATNELKDTFPKDYTPFLRIGALKGARIGVARDFFGQDAETNQVMESALNRLRELGATTLDVRLPSSLLERYRGMLTYATEFNAQIAVYLSTLAPAYPRTLSELIARAEDPATGYRSPQKLANMKRMLANALSPDDPDHLAMVNEGHAFVRATILALFAKERLDAIVYPTAIRAARPIDPKRDGRPSEATKAGTVEITATGGAAAGIANLTGFPDLVVPAGMTKEGLPVTISFLGTAFSEPKLLGYGFDFEQGTQAYVLPAATPELSGQTVPLR